MEYLQNLLDGSTVPVVTAFLLGLLTAISPCPLAANITAIGYIGRDITGMVCCTLSDGSLLIRCSARR